MRISTGILLFFFSFLLSEYHDIYLTLRYSGLKSTNISRAALRLAVSGLLKTHQQVSIQLRANRCNGCCSFCWGCETRLLTHIYLIIKRRHTYILQCADILKATCRASELMGANDPSLCPTSAKRNTFSPLLNRFACVVSG